MYGKKLNYLMFYGIQNNIYQNVIFKKVIDYG